MGRRIVEGMARLHVVIDTEFGAIAAAVDDDGAVIATAASGIRDGAYVAVDEAAVFEATGSLLPLPESMWDDSTA